jgi:hypothetical protein
MKKSLFLIATIIIGIAACNNDPRTKLPQSGPFGVVFDTTNSIAAESVDEVLDLGNNMGLKASGTIAQYCKGEGCWLTLKNKKGEEILVEVKDKAFVLPYNIDGKTAFVNGVATRETSEDGKSKITIEADGITLK